MVPFKAKRLHILRTKPPRDNIVFIIKIFRAAILNMLLLILSDIRIGLFQDGD